jgi:hypothetical protein
MSGNLRDLGTYRQRGRFSYLIIGTYVFLILIVLLFVPRSSVPWYAVYGVVVLFLFFLIRYLSTTYTLNDTHLGAWRLPGLRRVPLESVRRIEYTSLRDLGPSSFLGSWGWRGRMWSAALGSFDAVYTDPARGLLITGEGVPIYITPNDLGEFARELSRRVRSYTGRLMVDVGDPQGSQEDVSVGEPVSGGS